MSFLRGERAAETMAHRFRPDEGAFALWRERDLWVARTDAAAEATLSAFHALTAEMPGTVNVAITRARDGAEWTGANAALTDVREGIARLRQPLARTGGLVITLWGDGRQLAISAQLSTWAWAPSRSWRPLLISAGLREGAPTELADRRWARRAEEFVGSRELDEVRASVVARLGLAAPSRVGAD